MIHLSAGFAHKEDSQSIIPRAPRHKTIDISVLDGNAAGQLLDLRTESVCFFRAVRVTDEDKVVVVPNIIVFEELDHFGNRFFPSDRLGDDSDFSLRGEFEHGVNVHDHSEERGKRGDSSAVAQIYEVADDKAMVSVEFVILNPLGDFFLLPSACIFLA